MANKSGIRLAGRQVSLDRRKVLRDGQEFHLSPKAAAVLQSLIAHAPHAIAKRVIVDEVWGEAYPHDEVLSGVVLELRKALGDTAKAQEIIETIPKFGYRLSAELEDNNRDTRHKLQLFWLLPVLLSALVAAVYFWPDEETVPANPSKTDLSPARLLTQYPGIERHPAWAPDGNRFAFSWNRNGNFDLYIKSIEHINAEPVQITASAAEEGASVWSPAGDAIAFLRYAYQQQQCSVVVYHFASQQETVLAPCSSLSRNPYEFDGIAWSADAGRLAFYPDSTQNGAENAFLALYDFASNSIEYLDVATYQPVSNLAYPSWVPDQPALLTTATAANGSSQIIKIDLHTQTLTALHQAKQRLRYPYMNAAQELWFSQQQQFTQSIHGINQQRQEIVLPLPGISVNHIRDFKPAPDYRQAIFASTTKQGGIHSLALADFDWNKRTAWTRPSSIDRLPQLHPNDNLLVFMSARSGRYEIWQQDLGNGQATRISRQQDLNVAYPVWSARGHLMAYRAFKPDSSQPLIVIYDQRSGLYSEFNPEQYTGSQFSWVDSDQKLVYACGENLSKICLFSLDNHQVIQRIHIGKPVIMAKPTNQALQLVLSTYDGDILFINESNITAVTETRRPSIFPLWEVIGQQLFYMDYQDSHSLVLKQMDLESGTETIVGVLAEAAIDFYGFTVDHKLENFIFGHYQQNAADLMLLQLPPITR